MDLGLEIFNKDNWSSVNAVIVLGLVFLVSLVALINAIPFLVFDRDESESESENDLEDD